MINKSLISQITLLTFIALLSGCSEEVKPKRNPLKLLADKNQQYAQPNIDNEILFPDAHAAKKDYRQEWWYLTATLETEQGQSFASQWTLFRRSVADKHWYFAHAALADKTQHRSAYRNGREDLGSVGITTKPFSARIDDWLWQSSSELLPAQLIYGNAVGAINNLASINLIDNSTEKANATKTNKATKANKAKELWQVELNLSTTEPFFLQGDQGYSIKHPTLDIASHYYSQPFIEVSGQIYWQGQWQKVTGNAWFDREWASQMLGQDQQGWDWFSLRLNQDTALMVFRVRSITEDYFYASIMSRGGDIRTIASTDIKLTSHKTHGNSSYPSSFSLRIPQEDIDIKVDVVNEQQIMRFGIEYFEGMVTFNGSHQGQGFVEMTGYNDN
jgi:predicted secreted hydrolase